MSNKVINMTLKEPYFSMIKSGQKVVECRLYDSKRREIQIGDTVKFSNSLHKDPLELTVVGLLLAKNFETLFTVVDAKLAGLTDKKTAISIMEEFYDEKAQEKFGVVGIVLK